MKGMALFWFCCIAHAVPALGQVVLAKSITRTVQTTKQTRLDQELLRFLRFLHEADDPTDAQALFKVPLLVTDKHSDIGVYKFGLRSAHLGYRVVFQYQNRLVFSNAQHAAPLSTQLRHFLTQYPTAFTAVAQRTAQRQLTDIVEYNQTVGEGELPSKR